MNSTCGSAVNTLYIKMANRLVTLPRPDGTSSNPGNLIHLYSALMCVKSCKWETYTDKQTRKQKIVRLHGDVAALVHPPKWTQKHKQLINSGQIFSAKHDYLFFLIEWERKKWVSGRMINQDCGSTVPPGGEGVISYGRNINNPHWIISTKLRSIRTFKKVLTSLHYSNVTSI